MPCSYALGARFEGMVDELVKGGRYNNASEAVREGLRLLEDREEPRRLKAEEVRRSIEGSRRSGVPLSGEEVFGPLEARHGAPAERAGKRPPALDACGPRRPAGDRCPHRPGQSGARPSLRAGPARALPAPRSRVCGWLREEFGSGVCAGPSTARARRPAVGCWMSEAARACPRSASAGDGTA